MGRKITSVLGIGLAALLMSQGAAAITCSGPFSDNGTIKSTSATVDNATACQGPTGGNTYPDGGPNTVPITLPGGPWVRIDEALSGTNFNGGFSGNWSIDPTKVGDYNNFVLGLKPDGAVVYFLLSAFSGTWSVTDFANSHAALYGYKGDVPCCEEDVPEPGSLALLGLGLLGLGLGRRIKS